MGSQWGPNDEPMGRRRAPPHWLVVCVAITTARCNRTQTQLCEQAFNVLELNSVGNCLTVLLSFICYRKLFHSIFCLFRVFVFGFVSSFTYLFLPRRLGHECGLHGSMIIPVFLIFITITYLSNLGYTVEWNKPNWHPVWSITHNSCRGKQIW